MVTDPSESSLQTPLRPSSRPSGGADVLVIDDDPTTVDVVQRLLAREGIAVDTATTGEAGLSQVRTGRPLAVLLDIMLPDMSGWDILAKVKADPDLQRIPIAVHSIVDDRNRAQQLGADDYLDKPLDQGRLVTFVRTSLTQRGTGTSSREVA